MINKKSIIGIILAVVILGGAYWFLTHDFSDKTEDKKETEKVENVRTGTPVFESAKEKINYVKFENKNGTFELYNNGNEWTVKDYEDIRFNQYKFVSVALDYVKIIPTLEVLKDAKDLSPYGLDNPIATTTVKTSDGKEQTFILGSETKGGNGYYFMVKGDKTVYTITKTFGTNMQLNLADCRDTSLYTVDKTDIKEVNMTVRGIGEVSVKLLDEPIDSITTWKMSKPYDLGVYDEKFDQAVLTPITELSAIGFVSDNPTDEQLEKSGLKNTETYFEIKTDDAEYKILIGDKFDNNYVVKRSDMPSVYLVSEDSLSFLNIDIFEYLSSYAYLPKRDNFESIDVFFGGKTYTLKQENYSDKENRKLYINDVEIEEKLFTESYKNIVGTTIQNSVTEIPETKGEPLFSYVVKNKDGTEDKVEYVKMNGMYLYQYINGKCNFYVKAEDIENAENSIKQTLEEAKNPQKTETSKKSSDKNQEKTFNWVALLLVILVIALVAVFPISMLFGNKKSKK